MLQRCYNNKQLSYFDCEVCDEWLCFQNFAKWYEENYYEIEGEDEYYGLIPRELWKAMWEYQVEIID